MVSAAVEALRITNGDGRSTDKWGGGLFARTYPPGAITIKGNLFDGNFAKTRAGGLYVDSSAAVTVAGNAFRDNVSGGPDDGYGGLPFGGGAVIYRSGVCAILNNLFGGPGRRHRLGRVL